MYITLVSACQRRALKRTRAVLDSYALRIGERTWSTPITEEGLQEMRSLLRRSATRQTAVACYRNHGAREMRLLWIVGSRQAFGPTGHYPAGTRQRRAVSFPPWIRPAALLASASGLGHDLGKTIVPFQEMLNMSVNGKGKDYDFKGYTNNSRHEWVSMRLLQELRAHSNIELSWQADLKLPAPKRQSSFYQGINRLDDALDYVVASHHRLFGPADGGLNKPDATEHTYRGEKMPECAVALGNWPHELHKAIDGKLERVRRITQDLPATPAYWRGLAYLARAALILADHEVSGRELSGKVTHRYFDASIHANTHPPHKGGGYNQPLGWHLEAVSQLASDRAWRLGTLRLPRLSEQTVNRLLEEAASAPPQYQWQWRAVQAAQRCVEGDSPAPVLILNIAATGSGKTRANALIASTLRPRPRFSIALNLRTLTLQTGSALEKCGLARDELATVIGDRPAKKLHEWQKTTFNNQDDEIDVELEVQGSPGEAPAWMDFLLKKKPGWEALLTAPVLVSTIDFLAAAGEPGRQAHHVAAMLRLIDSDLVLDEIDSYDAKSLVAVLRIVHIASMLGRHVICSSATLPVPIAKALREVFLAGAESHLALHQQKGQPQALIVDNQCAPLQVPLDDGFEQRYLDYVAARTRGNAQPVYRKPDLLKIGGRGIENWQEAVLSGVQRLHRDHGWQFVGTEKRVSFGLVRVANIKTAIPLARMLANRLPHARIACYHSQDLRLQRFHKEHRLDYLLSRHKGDTHIGQDPEIQQIVHASKADDVPFIVIATPAEEIGRDHDFDWGVIEPSSMHSIIQASGRINRHRLIHVLLANILILEYNARWATNKSETDLNFIRPGLEKEGRAYPSPSLADLLNWSVLDRIDAALRFDETHQMPVSENEFLEEDLSVPVDALCAKGRYKSQWMTQGFYKQYPLRDNACNTRWVVTFDNESDSTQIWRYHPGLENKLDPASQATRNQRVANDWLTLDVQTLYERYSDSGLTTEEAFTVETQGAHMDVTWDQSFGWYRPA